MKKPLKTDVSPMLDIIVPDWPTPSHVTAGCTTRAGGCSEPPFDSLNLADHVGDARASVERNRRYLHQACQDQLTTQTQLRWTWLTQTHSTDVIELDNKPATLSADAACSSTIGQVCCVLTADCLPILLCDKNGTRVAAIHAGWRGLANGIVGNSVWHFCHKADYPECQHAEGDAIKNDASAATKSAAAKKEVKHPYLAGSKTTGLNQPTTQRTKIAPQELYAWLGPAIGPTQFEVGPEVKQQFLHHFESVAGVEQAFQNRYANLYQLARLALAQAGVQQIYGGDFCTVSQASRFFSYRRDGDTGRMASFIFIDQRR